MGEDEGNERRDRFEVRPHGHGYEIYDTVDQRVVEGGFATWPAAFIKLTSLHGMVWRSNKDLDR